ncbi:unnamed protein product [Penicillium salamii]|nr:unnamed protein product [Penicillium salamii]
MFRPTEQRVLNGELITVRLTPHSLKRLSLTLVVEILRSLAFPQMLDRRENVEPCHINTCEWILDMARYQSWRKEYRGLLWIKGNPGAGKSTLMLFLHGKLQSSGNDNHGIQLDFFFTARGTEMQRTPLGMLRSLLNQIFDRDATVRPQVREAYEQRVRLFGQGEGRWEWAQPILEELLASVILAAASRQNVSLFVDALDEAGAESAQQLATYFHRLIDRAKQKKVAVRICISCRHYPIVESDQTVEIHIERHNHKDIAAYITDTLAGADVEENLSEETKETLTKQLIQQANGIFQWARLIVPAARRRISEAESFDEICRWLREVPADLEGVYMCILNDVIEARNLEQSFLLFQWVCLAERPLSVIEMRYALAAKNAHITRTTQKWERIDGFIESDKRMKGRIKALSGGLAEVILSEDASETVQVVHQSVNDFLRAKGLAALSDKITPSSEVLQKEEILSRCQANLYRSCLVYLALQRVRGDIPSDLEDAKQSLTQNHPLLDYATVNLFIHAEKAAHSRILILPNEQDVLHQMIEQWVQNYRNLDTFRSTCPARGTTVIHMAAAANLVDIIERLPLNSDDVTRRDEDGNTPFHLAARYGQVKAGGCLREKMDNFDEPNNVGTTPFIEAASYGHAGFVEWLLLEGIKLEGEMGNGETALHDASLGGHQKVVGVLIAAGARVNTQGGHFGNALQAASYGDSIKIVQMLLNAGANINAQGGHYGNALQAAAASQGSPEILQMLLDAGADVNAQGGEYGNALQAASYGESIEMVQMLLNAGADINAQGGHYGNALQAAAASSQGSPEILQMLLDVGADVNAQGGEYGNALQAASYSESIEMVQMLLNAGTDVNAQGGEYNNALQAAASSQGSPEILQMLLDAGADVNAQGDKYGNALQAALYGESIEMVQMLLDAGTNVNAQGGEYGNALQAAAVAAVESENCETVKVLLDAGADVNAQGGQYGNALQTAVASQGSPEILQMLLDAGADINAQGGEFGNALQAAAAIFENSKTVAILLNAGADVNAYGGQYGNALQAAAAISENCKTVKVLLDAGADVNVQGGHYGNALQAAAATSENCKTVKILLDAGADVNAQGGEYGNALQLAAARSGNSKTVAILLDAGADVNMHVNAQGSDFSNALQAAAAISENSKTVAILLDAGADVNAHGGQYGNALQTAAAAMSENCESVKMLLDAGADVNAQGGYYGNALQAAAAAAMSENCESVKMLLDAGADVNAQGGYYGNALQAAAAISQNYETVKILLDAGADANAQGGKYGNALQAVAADVNAHSGHYGNALQDAAAISENYKTMKILLDAGADVNAQGGKYGNALQAAAAAAMSENCESVKMLLEAGADVNAQGGQYGNALQAAAASSFKSNEFVATLLGAGADVNLQGGEYGNALQAAAAASPFKNSEVVAMLLNAGADVNAWGGIFGSSLLAIVHKGHADQVEMLLHAGANVLLADELDQTPLHIAALNNRLNILRQFPGLLLPINNRDKLSRTPLHLAITLGHFELAIYLLECGANPSLLDGYGRNILDWVVGNESLVHQIRGHRPSIVLTPDTTQELVVRRSIRQISDTLLQSQLDYPGPLLQQLGRYLLFVNELDNAQCLFQLHLFQRDASGNYMYEIECDKCDRTIDGSRFICSSHFVCSICAHMDLCIFCQRQYRFHSRLHPNQEHKTIEVPHVDDGKYLLSASATEELRSIVDKYSAPKAHQSGERPSHDSTSCLPSEVIAPGSTAAVSTAPLRPISMFRLLLLGILPLLLIYLYSLV